MSLDSGSMLSSLGVFSITVGVLSMYANIASYYGTKYKLKGIEKRYGSEIADEVFTKDLAAYKSPMTSPLGGIGIKLLKKKRG